MKEITNSSTRKVLFQDLTPQAVAQDPFQAVPTHVSVYRVNLFVPGSLNSIFSHALLNYRTRLMIPCLMILHNQKKYLHHLPQRLAFTCSIFLFTTVIGQSVTFKRFDPSSNYLYLWFRILRNHPHHLPEFPQTRGIYFLFSCEAGIYVRL